MKSRSCSWGQGWMKGYETEPCELEMLVMWRTPDWGALSDSFSYWMFRQGPVEQASGLVKHTQLEVTNSIRRVLSLTCLARIDPLEILVIWMWHGMDPCRIKEIEHPKKSTWIMKHENINKTGNPLVFFLDPNLERPPFPEWQTYLESISVKVVPRESESSQLHRVKCCEAINVTKQEPSPVLFCFLKPLSAPRAFSLGSLFQVLGPRQAPQRPFKRGLLDVSDVQRTLPQRLDFWSPEAP